MFPKGFPVLMNPKAVLAEYPVRKLDVQRVKLLNESSTVCP